MAQMDDLYAALKNADAAGDVEGARKLAAYIQTQPAAAPAPAAPEPGGFMQGAGNLAAGAVRGAGSIGATLLTPVDAAARAVGIQNDYIGRTDRRQAMDESLQGLGAQPDSLLYKGGKLGAEIAGTAGAGGAAANVLGRTALATAAPATINALRTAGMSAGNGGMLANGLARVTGGAANGALSAGLVNPEDAGAGALIGGALPGVVKVAGAAGNKLASVLRGADQPADLAAAVQAARTSGFVIPPTQANPNLLNRALEGFSGKITTAQKASAANGNVVNAKAVADLGLPVDTKLTPDVLATLRKTAGQAYDAIGNAGTVTPGQTYADALDKIAAPFLKASQGFPNAKASPVIDLVESLRSPSFDAGSAVAKIKELRTAADDGFRTGNTDVARASKSAATALEDALESHLQQAGNPAALQDFKDARTLIAKTYSVEKALNGTTGNVDARKLATQLAKGKPLSGGLKESAEFAARFPKAAQTVEGMGSLPGTSPLDWGLAAGTTAITGNPLAMLGTAARPAARALTLSPMIQNRLVQGARGAPSQAAINLLQTAYRGAPLIRSDR